MSTKTAVGLPYTIAKVRAMRSRLYEGDRLGELERARSIPELAQRLGFGEVAVGHLQLEALLVARHIADLLKVAPLLDGARGELYDWLLVRYQMENLKVVLRFWAAGEPVGQLARHLVEVPGLPSLPVAELAEVGDLADFIGLVPEPVFARGLSRGLAYWQAEGRTFFAETGLDAAYFQELIRRHAALGRADRQVTEQLVRVDLDTYNVLLVARAQLNYHLQLEDVAGFVVAGGRISPEALVEARGQALSDILSRLEALALMHLGEEMPTTLPQLEDAMALRLYRVANRRYYQSMLDLGAVVAFYYLKRNELANLVRVVEGLRYQVGWSEISGRLIPPSSGRAG